MSKMSVAQIGMLILTWTSDNTLKDRIINECSCGKLDVASIENMIRENHPRWFRHVWHKPIDAL